MQALPPLSFLLHALCESPWRPHVPRLIQPRAGGVQPQGEAKPRPARTGGGHRQHVPEGRGGHRCREKCLWEIFPLELIQNFSRSFSDHEIPDHIQAAVGGLPPALQLIFYPRAEFRHNHSKVHKLIIQLSLWDGGKLPFKRCWLLHNSFSML